MERNDQAFPIADIGVHGSYGLTKRELLAAMAMQGQLSSGIPGEHYRVTHCAKAAVEFADALLAALATSANLKEPQHGTE
jgi:hypothetical protein